MFIVFGQQLCSALLHDCPQTIHFHPLGGNAKDDPSAPQYSAHSESDILVILDVSPDQSMIDEGVAREVVNRMQKLRKKGKLVPTDPVTIHWSTKDDALAQLINAHQK